MDDDRVKGAARKIVGKTEEAVGALTDDPVARTNGRLDEVEGTLQGTFGRLKDAGLDLAALRQLVSDRPIAVALLAVAAGFGIGCLMRRR
jgi:uncharacterized protein YjbJ (UPF0337 family)